MRPFLLAFIGESQTNFRFRDTIFHSQVDEDELL